MEDPATPERLKFYGPHDIANGWMADQAVALVHAYSEDRVIRSLNDVLEVHNALAFEERGILPSSLTQHERDELAFSARVLRRQVAAFFSKIDSSNVRNHLTGFEYQYAEDLLVLVERHNVGKAVGGQELFDALVEAGMPLSGMLSDRAFVKRHDRRLREVLLTDARNGELLVSSRMVKDPSTAYTFPESLSGADSLQLLSDYIESESPHPNYLDAIAQAKDNEAFGVTPKIRLQARRRYEALTKELFSEEKNILFKNGYGVRIDPEQRAPVLDQIERANTGHSHMRSFGEQYLASSVESERVLDNFASVVGYLDRYGLLTMPSFQRQIGTIERLFISGKDVYPKGLLFKHFDSLTILGTQAYTDFLRHKGVEVEEAIAWFFREHLADEYGAEGFYYTPSTSNSSFLERCRHVCAEMESIVRQFTLFCDEGELDHDLLRMTSAPRPWGQIPSLVTRKYVQRIQNSDCDRVLRLLFSDQSRITYINQSLRARSFVELVTQNQLLYADLHHYQREPVDWLISGGLVAVDDGGVVDFAWPTLVLVLSDINEREAGAQGRYGADESAAALTLVNRGWLQFRSTLLTSAETSYFNYFLNKSEFSDGPDLRNRYAHGTNADPDDTAAHRHSYLQIIRLMIALVLKIQDDFETWTASRVADSQQQAEVKTT